MRYPGEEQREHDHERQGQYVYPSAATVDAAGYAAVGTPEDEPVRLFRAPAPALVLARLVCLAGFAFAIY